MTSPIFANRLAYQGSYVGASSALSCPICETRKSECGTYHAKRTVTVFACPGIKPNGTKRVAPGAGIPCTIGARSKHTPLSMSCHAVRRESGVQGSDRNHA